MVCCLSSVMTDELLEMLLFAAVFVLGWFATRLGGTSIASIAKLNAKEPGARLQQLALAADVEGCLALWTEFDRLKLPLETLDGIASMLSQKSSPAHLEVAADMALTLRSSSLAEAVISASEQCELSWRTATAAKFLCEDLELSSSSITELLWTCAQKQQHKQAFDLWKLQATTMSQASQGNASYEAMLEICTEASEMSLAADVARLGHWQTPDSQFGRIAMRKVILWLIDRDVETAVSAFRACLTRSASFDLVIFRSLIRALARLSDVAVALELIDESLKQGLRLDYDCFAMLVKAHCKQGAPSLAADVLSDMQDYRPTVSLCEVVLQTCISVRDGAVAMWTLEFMARLSMRPSSAVLASVVRFLGQEADVQDVISVIRSLPGLDVDLHVHDSLLRVLLVTGHPELAFEQLRTMREMGLLPSPMTCDVVLAEHLRQGRLYHAVVFVEEALLEGRHLNPETVHKLLQALGRRGALEALPLASRLVHAGVEVPHSLFEAFERGAGCASRVARRRSEWQQWRFEFGDRVAAEA